MTRDVSSGSSLFALRVQAKVSPTYADPNVGGSVSFAWSAQVSGRSY